MMTDLFNFLDDSAPPSTSLTCASVQDLESRMQAMLTDKVTETRAEHVSFTFELSSSTKFTLHVSESENESLEALGNLDPSLGGAASLGEVQNVDGQMARVINASDTIMNQPQNDPVLQRAIAKHIITALGRCDVSTWTVREVSRGTHGWTFTYLCKDSMQAWNRANGKIDMSLIGDYSQKELDPVIADRPAFDCRGTVTIGFSKSSRSITVHYEHTPMHKTVAQLLEYFAPPPPQRPERAEDKPKKTPKSSKKRDAPADWEEGGTRKKQKKRKSEAQDPADPNVETGDGMASADVSMVDAANSSAYPDPMNNGQVSEQAVEQSTEKPKKKRAPRPKKPKANAGESANGDQTANNGGLHLNSIVNVDPAEAARRRERALNLLQGAKIDPNTLSADQFNIFANQSPALQKESLAMLVEHGAEKLRIVHPNREESTPITIEPTPQASAKPAKKSRQRTSDARAGDGTDAVSTPKPKLTRGPCNECKQRKIQCNRSKPICDMCAEAGIQCVYAVAIPRAKKKSEVVAVEDDEEDQPLVDVVEEEQPHEQADRSSPSLDSPGFNTDPAPVEAIEHPVNEHPVNEGIHIDSGPQSATQDYFQSSHNLALPDLSQQAIAAASNLGFGDTQDHRLGDTLSNPAYALANPTPHPEPVSYPPPPTQAIPEPQQSPSASQRQSKSSGPRRSLPSGPQRQPVADSSALALPQAAPTANSNWSSVVSRNDTVSPVPAANQPSSSQTVQGSSSTDMYTHGATGARTSMGNQPSPTVQAATSYNQGRSSPYQSQAQNPRAKSRQGNRTQSHTPVNERPVSQVPRSSTPQQSQVQPSQRHSRNPSSQGHQTPQGVAHASQGSSATGYNNAAPDLSSLGSFGYNSYGATTSDQSNTRIAYEPYQEHPATSGVTPTYNAYDYNRTGSKSVSMTTPVSESTSSGYTAANTATDTNEWSSTQSRTSGHSYGSSSTPATSSYSYPATTQTATPSQFNLRTNSPGQNQSFTQQATTQQQPTHHQPQQQQQQHRSYGSYNQTQSQNQYEFHSSSGSFTAANSSSANYRSSRTNPAAYTSNSYQQQHHSGLSMPNHGGHTYGTNDDDAALMDILRGSVGNRG